MTARDRTARRRLPRRRRVRIALAAWGILALLVATFVLGAARPPDGDQEIAAATGALADDRPVLAEAHARRALTADERDPRAWLLLAEALRATGRERERLHALARAAALSPTWPAPAIELAVRDLATGAARRARDRLDRCLAGRPGPAPAHRLRARARLALGDARGSIRDLVEAGAARDLLEAAGRARTVALRSGEARDADHARALAERARDAADDDETAAAARLLLGELEPLPVGGWLRVEALARTERLEEAHALATTLLASERGRRALVTRIGPGGSAAWGVLLGLVAPHLDTDLARRIGRRRPAARGVLHELAHAGHDARGRVLRACDLLCAAAWARDARRDVVEHATRARECAPQDVRGGGWLARAFGAAGDVAGFEQLREGVDGAQRKLFDAWYAVGGGDLDVGGERLETLVARGAPRAATWRLALALAAELRAAGGPPRVRACFERIASAAPSDPVAPYVLGALAAAVHEHDRAVARYRDSLAREPSFVPARNDLAWTLATACGDLDAAREHAERARGARPDDAAVLDTYGWVQHLAGDHAAAVASLERAAWRRPGDPGIEERHAAAREALRREGGGR